MNGGRLNISKGQWALTLPSETITYPPQMPQSLRDRFKPFQKTSHIYRLYLHYCYLLGVLLKKTTYHPTSPYLKEALRKLDELSNQVWYMSKYGMETSDDLYAERERLQGESTKLQNKIHRASPAEKETLWQEKSGVTERITELRKQLKLNKALRNGQLKYRRKPNCSMPMNTGQKKSNRAENHKERSTGNDDRQ